MASPMSAWSVALNTVVEGSTLLPVLFSALKPRSLFSNAHSNTNALEPSIAITTFITVGSYIPITIIITEWRGCGTHSCMLAFPIIRPMDWDDCCGLGNASVQAEQKQGWQHAKLHAICCSHKTIPAGLLVCMAVPEMSAAPQKEGYQLKPAASHPGLIDVH
eukprot:scaffold194924_cov24-Tisochrysis_lutea.AAC.2